MKIEGYAKEFATVCGILCRAKRAPHQTDLKAESKLVEMFPSGRHYPPNYDEGYPPTYGDESYTKREPAVEFDGQKRQII